jgi:3-methyladenine DNA glycosylase/8-oxoguanine DNA glycosylase
LHERFTARRKDAGEVREVRDNRSARRQVLQNQVADDNIRDRVLDAVEALARDGTELDPLVGDGGARLLEHRRRDIEREHAVEPLRKRGGHSPRPGSDLDARPASRVGSEPLEERLQLDTTAVGIADVGVRIGRERVPRRPHLHVLSVSVSRALIAVVREIELRPRGPYSLALTARLAYDATRSFLDGVLTCALEGELVHAWQRPSGEIVLRAESDAAVERLRFVLALEDDHSEFLRRFADDPLLGEAIRQLRGLRPLRVPTVAGALLRALCGQLIQSHHARDLERTIVRATSERLGRLATPPTTKTLAARSPADLRRIGLHARRSATLVRVCRSLDLERLRDVPIDAVATRLLREPGLGPWSLGVIALEGLGSYERGLVGDLGLLKLCKALQGRWVEAEETAELLAPYGEWQGLASVYLLRGFARGLIPLPTEGRGPTPTRAAA